MGLRVMRAGRTRAMMYRNGDGYLITPQWEPVGAGGMQMGCRWESFFFHVLMHRRE